MNLSAFCTAAVAAQATGVLPASSVVIVEEEDGEGAINLKITDTCL